jgi:hypothetical protein
MTQNGQENAATKVAGSVTDDGQVRDVLIAAKALIADPKDWCGDGPGSSGYGEMGPGTRCSMSAMRLVGGANEFFRALAAFKRANGLDFVDAWNDAASTTHEMVMDAFDRAIASVTATRGQANTETSSDLGAKPNNPTSPPTAPYDNPTCGQTRTRSPEVLERVTANV